MVGGPSQMDLFDYKPQMQEYYDKDLPDSVRMGQRLTTMTSGQKRFPIAPSKFKFAQYGNSGMWVSELLPNLAKSVDDICFIRSMHTEAINHEPAICYHANRQPDHRPPLPGLVALLRPGFVERRSADVRRDGRQAHQYRAGAGHLGPALVERLSAGRARRRVVPHRPATRSCTSTIPPGVPSDVRRTTLDGLRALNELNYEQVGDPETHTRIQQYELAFRMQSSVPALTDLSDEPEWTDKLYGDAVRKPGTFRQHGAVGAAHGRARRAVRAGLSEQLGHARQRRRPPARPVPRYRPAVPRPDPGSQSPRTVRRNADHLGRRVRPHRLLAGRPDEGELRPRPSSALLHHVDGRRRRQGRHRSTARPTTSPTTSSKIPCRSATSTPPCSSCWASTTSGSPTAPKASTSGSPPSSRPR